MPRKQSGLQVKNKYNQSPFVLYILYIIFPNVKGILFSTFLHSFISSCSVFFMAHKLQHFRKQNLNLTVFSNDAAAIKINQIAELN